jgi:hypothetical protein
MQEPFLPATHPAHRHAYFATNGNLMRPIVTLAAMTGSVCSMLFLNVCRRRLAGDSTPGVAA